MVTLLATVVVLLSVVCVAACCLLYGLLRQNGRVLIRLDAVEAALEESQGERRTGGVFADRPLAGSKINRAGLAPGTVAPAFRLPTVDGREVALSDFLGRRLLLVFSDPACGPCAGLLPRLEAAARRSDVAVLIVSRGGVDANRRKLAEYGVTLPVALQGHWEISRLYAKFSTPMAYLIDEHGRIVSEVASGATPILALLSTGGSELRLPTTSGPGPGSRLSH
jgi:peroxiredoxin